MIYKSRPGSQVVRRSPLQSENRPFDSGPGLQTETWLSGLKRLPYKQRSRIPITEPRLAGSNPAVSAPLYRLDYVLCS